MSCSLKHVASTTALTLSIFVAGFTLKGMDSRSWSVTVRIKRAGRFSPGSAGSCAVACVALPMGASCALITNCGANLLLDRVCQADKSILLQGANES